MQLASGADLLVITLNTRIHLNDVLMKQYLNEEMARSDPIVLGYTCNTLLLLHILTVILVTTPPLNAYEYARQTRISNLAGYPFLRVVSCMVLR